MSAARMLGFALAGAHVSVVSDVDDVLLWLEEFLRPGFVCGPTRADAPTVVVHGTQRPLPAGTDNGSLPCFALDREVVHHPGFVHDGVTEVVDGKFGARYVIGDNRVDVYPDGDCPRLRVAVMRVVRELAVAGALAQTAGVQLHASGFAEDGRVVLLAGPKEAGKTTMLAHLCASTGSAMVANDRILVTPAWQATPVATIVSVRAGTVEQLPDLFSGVPAIERPAHLTMAEAERVAGVRGTITGPGRLKLSPPQLAQALGVPLSPGGAVAAIALLAVDPATESFTVRPLDAAEARPQLAGVQYGASVAGAPPTIFEQLVAGGDGLLGATSGAAVLQHLAEDVPSFELRVGPAFLRSRVAADDLAAALLAGG